MPDYLRKPILVLGCGNILFGDDGFGPAVIGSLEKKYQIPEDVGLLDVGSAAREILFNIILNQIKPRKVIIVDAVDAGRNPGEVFELSLEQIPENKIDDFSMHQLPTSNLLKELKQFCNVEVRIICAQVKNIPKKLGVGLSRTLIASIPKACKSILELCTNGESSTH